MEELFQRKAEKKDFDVIAWQVEDRATRGGGEFGMWLSHEAKRRGLRVFFAGDDQLSGPYAPVVRVAKYEAAKETSVGNGKRSAQGQKWAQKQGFFRAGGPTPLGCDRLYCGEDNKPKFTIHNLPNGLQEQRDYTTGAVIGRYGTFGKKSRNRFRKQRNEYSLLLPGDRQQRRTVRVIFYLRYKRGWRGQEISDYLNRNGIPSPKGKEWSQRQVEIIYENEAYTGVTFNDQTYSGRYFRRDRELGFVALDRDEIELVVKKTFSPRLRPMDEWDRIDQPHMYEFLPRDLRDLAITAQAKVWKDRTNPARRRKTPTAYPASDYLLSGRLRAIQDGEYLTGTMCGPADYKIPYYRHPRSRRGHRKDGVYNNMIPALALHDALMLLLAEVLTDVPELSDRLSKHLEEQRTATLEDQPDVMQLTAERDELALQIKTLVRTLKGALADAADELQRMGDRRNAIEALLAAAQGKHQQDNRPVEKVIEEAIQTLAEDSRRLLKLPIEPLKDVMNRMIADASVDLETKAVELKINLPTWALAPRPKPKKKPKKASKQQSDAAEALCPADHLQSQAMCWTQVQMATYRCEYRWNRGSTVQPPCYLCRRQAA